MTWRELTIRCPAILVEPISALLTEQAGGCAYEERAEEAVLRIWLPDIEEKRGEGEQLRRRLAEIAVLFGIETPPHISERLVKETDWAEAWKQHWKPLRIGRRLVIKPSWHPWPPPEAPEMTRPDDLLIELDPGQAFGTGTHPTTALCLEALEEALENPNIWADGERAGSDSLSGIRRPRVLDFGCGSGILAIAAARLGASEVWAFDHDPVAVAAAQANCARNGVRCHIFRHDSLAGLPPDWDIIVANISLPVLVANVANVAACLAPTGLFIGSGFYAPRFTELAEALQAVGLSHQELRTNEEWGCVLARR